MRHFFGAKAVKWMLLGLVLLIVQPFVYAAFTDDVYIVETVNLFPSRVSAEGWKNWESITFQNLDEYSLLQEFNKINSAFLSDNSKSRWIEKTESVEEFLNLDGAVAGHDNESVIPGELSIEEQAASTTFFKNPTTSTDVLFDISSSASESFERVELDVTTTTESVSTEPVNNFDDTFSVPLEDKATTTVFRRVSSVFALAVETVTELLSATTSAEEQLGAEDQIIESVHEVDIFNSTFSIASSAKDVEVVEVENDVVSDETSTATVKKKLETALLAETSVSATSSDFASTTALDATQPHIEEDDLGEFLPKADEEVENNMKSQVCDGGCAPHSIILSDFGYPIDEDVELFGAQLRMSLAAKKKLTRENIPTLYIKYSTDNGTSWNGAGSIEIEDEVSNAVNGGYFLFFLDEVVSQDSLNNLQVKLLYQDDPDLLSELFIESAWLELFVVEPPEYDVNQFFESLLANDGYTTGMLSGDKLELPDRREVELTFTDENEGENLVIKTDKENYVGLTKTTTYFSVTNESSRADEFQIQTYFPQGVGRVVSLKEYNQNKPQDLIIPEYKPFIYHCEAGWDYTGDIEADNLEDLSRAIVPESDSKTASTTWSAGTSTPRADFEFLQSTSSADVTNTTPLDLTTTTVSLLVPDVAELMQFSTTTFQASKTSSSLSEEGEFSGNLQESYTCRNTNVTRKCDYIGEDNTTCNIENFKVAEHAVVNYKSGWDEVVQEVGSLEGQGFWDKVSVFLGLQAGRKEVPARFEPRTFTPDSYRIEAGETKYFEMQIAFPPLSSGEYWIETVGKREYGLLDPFWSSQWSYRLPISIDNVAGASELTEQQIFLELDSSLTDFWNNSNEDGSDIRFVQETVVGSEEDWYNTGWTSRLPITIQSSQVDETMTDFPVYVDLSDLGSEFFSIVQNDGDDIRVTENDGLTERPIELVSINTGAETGELHFSGDVSSTTDTTFYIYFGNSDAAGYAETDTYGSQNVWGSEFIAVYHLEEDASGRGTTGLYQDSTSNQYDADDELSSTGKSGKLGQGQEVNAQGDANEYMLLPSGIVNSESQLTFAYWMNSSDAGNQALINGGANNEYLLYMTSGGTSLTFFPGSTIGITDLSASVWRYVLVSRDSTANQWRIFIDGVEDDNSPSAATLGTLSIPADCLVLGLEQDSSCLNSGDTSQHLNASVDEMRFWNIIPSDGEVTATYRNQSTTTDFYATSSLETFTNTTFSELDYWVQHFSTSTQEADIWVQVDSLPAGASTTIYLYYGNSGAASASDEMAPFTYSTTTDLYYVVNDDLSTAVNLYSYIDNNVIIVDGGTPISLDAGEVTSISTYSSTTVISALGPVTSLNASGDGPEPVVPISFATTTHAYPSVRGTEEFDIHAPFADADVSIYDGNAGTPSATTTVVSGATVEQSSAAAASSIIEADNPILVFASNNTSSDSVVTYPPTTRDLYGMATRDYFYTSISTGGQVAEFCSVSSPSTSTAMTRGSQDGNGNCNPANNDDGSGEGVRLTNITEPIAAIQERDSDGTEASVFLPEMEFGSQYIIPADMNYIAIVCSPRLGTSTISVYTSTGSEVDSGTCAPSGTNEPGTLLFDGGNGDSLLYTQGYSVRSTNNVPFWIMYEESNQDGETNTWGAPQGRKYSTELNYSFGAQEVTIDAQYEQLSFGWYENAVTQTPTSTWPLGEGSFATEGVAITGQGAINDGDVLRLRINLQANVATGSASSTAFKLQYTEAATSQCSAATAWSDVGEIGSTTAAFNGYNNSSLTDGSTLSSTTLASSTVFETYEEQNLSAFIANSVDPNEVAEWDWALTANNANVNSNYCFRMVRSTGLDLATYTSYPEVETAGPPLAPTLILNFDNERTATYTPPVLSFAASDLADDGIRYQIQIDNDLDFSSPTIDRDSQTHFAAGEFENLNTPSNKNPYNSGEEIRFTSISNLVASTTYWWRVRGRDTDGSDTWGEWSESWSFTTDGSVQETEWHQTTGDQFTTNTLTNVSTTSGAAAVVGSSGTMTSSPIDFDDATVGNAWGEFSWSDTETSGTILYQVEYLNGSSWDLVPDSQIANNSVGTGTSPINLLDLDTDTYNQIRLVANFSGTVLSVEEWTVVWGQRVNEPTLIDPFNNEKIATTGPTFRFSSTDPQGDALEYEISWGTDDTFVSSTTRSSASDPGFVGSSPYTSGATVSYDIQSGEALTNGETYWWRARARDPFGGNAYSPWSDPYSFTVDTTVTVSTWFQTTAEQFQTGVLSGVSASSTGDFATNDAQVGEFGTVVVTNGSTTEVTTQRTYNDPVVVASVRYDRTGADGTQRYARVQDKTADTFTLYVSNYDDTVTGTTTVDYIVMESGDWTLDDGGSGTRIVAGTVSVSTVSGRSVPTNPGGTAVTFSPVFSGSAPAVITTVSSNNDSNWVLSSIYDGSNTVNGPTTGGFTTFLNLNWVTPISHGSEDVDYIAMGQGNGTVGSSEFHSILTADTIRQTPAAVTFSPAFTTVPQVTLASQSSQDGGDGGYGMVDTDSPTTVNEVYVSVDEDGPSNTRGGHATEFFSVIAFEGSSGALESQAGDGLTGTIESPAIPFSDGAGPKFERALFYASSTGGSTTTVQVQYQTATGSWALIPDSVIPGNSVGTSSSPIDLTGVDVGTYDTIRLSATLVCSSSACPTLNDWTVEWSEGVPVSGTIAQYDRSTPVTSGTVQVAINGTPGNTGSIAGDGTWTINNVTAFDGDVITVWVDGAADPNEAVAVFVYDGAGDMEDVELFEQHLSLSSNENGTTTNALLGAYDNSVSSDEDIFFDVDGSNDLTVCSLSGCSEASLYVGTGNIYIPDTGDSGNIVTHDFVNDGTFELDGNTMRVSGSWKNNATIDLIGSTVIFTATSTSETVDDVDNLLDFDTLTFGETSGSATWTTFDPLDVSSDLNVDFGTLDRSSSTINVSGDLITGVNGLWIGISTTTFDGSTGAQWVDNSVSVQDIGYVVIDGSAKAVSLQSDVKASSITVGADDSLNAGGANTLFLSGNFTNNNTFSAQTGTIEIIGIGSNAIISANGSSLYNLTASTTGGGTVAFVDPNITILGDFTIATGTVTLPTATTSLSGSFSNTGGTFAHNNAEVRFIGSGSETIELMGTEFFNHFYDVSFTGSGDWTFIDTNATTSNTLSISNGNVVLPSGQLSVARDFAVSGSGSFDHNGGEVLLLIDGNDTAVANGSSFNDVLVRQGGGGSGSWYDENWLYRLPITIRSSEIDNDLTDFPIYVDLADLPSAFFSNINSDGGDIRVTESDGTTEVAREIVNASTSAQTGELYFNASSVSSTTDTVFYLYYGNNVASDYLVSDTYGAENTWSNGYVLVAHMNDLTTSSILNSANGSLNGTKASAGNPNETSTGKIYEAQADTSADHISFGNLGNNSTNITISAWMNPTDLTGTGDNATYGFTLFSAHSSGNYTWLTAGGTGNGGSPSEIRFCGFSSSATCNVGSGSNLATGKWSYISAASVDGGAATVRVDGSQVLSFTSDGGGTWNSGSTIGDLRPARNIEFAGQLDEIQVSNVVRSTAWQDATYRNQATTTDFYAVGSPQQDNVRTFSDTNVTALGNVVIESGTAVFPTGNFAIGGSFDNNDTFDSNGGTVLFNSSTGAETIAPGATSTFYNLTFNSGGGDWTITENATATNAITLTNADTLTVNPGIVLDTAGVFSNELANASTTWTGATLRLSGGIDLALNSKDNEGDDYNILSLTGDGDVSMWNSTAATYDTQASSSIYSQDHAGTDGDLYIFGDYVRSGGSEYWSYTTDFDGIDLVASSSERQVNVRVAGGSFVTASSATLLILGSSTASTTIDAQSGSFSLTTTNATLTAQYFTMTGTGVSGFNLTSSTTVISLDDAEFTIPGASTAITVDASTVDTNPAAQFFNTDFSSGPVNVTLSGSPSSFWWFRDGIGDRYGESYDSGDGDPGSIRWDDSSYSITIAGTAYADAGVTTLGGPTCDGFTQNVRVVVDGGAFASSTVCSGLDGSYSFPGVNYVGNPNIVVYLDTNGGEKGAVITKTPTADILDLDIYANRVITRHEDVSPLSIADMVLYDYSDDTDLQFIASTTSDPDTLTVLAGNELFIATSSTFTPGGVVTLAANAQANSYDGTLYIAEGATFNAYGTSTLTIGGRLELASTTSIFDAATTTVLMNATTSGKSITAPSEITFYDLDFNGSGGGWNIGSDIQVDGDMMVTAGSVTGTGDISISGGSLTGNGTLSLGGGTTTLEATNTLGGTSAWTFYNLQLGDGADVGTTTPVTSATTTVLGRITISTAHFLDAGATQWDLAGTATVFVEDGTFLEDTSTVRYSGNGASVLSTQYYNLDINAGAGGPTYTATGIGIIVDNNLTIGGDSASLFDLNVNDPALDVNGDVIIRSNGTLNASDSGVFNIAGSYTNNGSFAGNGSTLTFDGSGTIGIAAGNSSFSNVTINATGDVTVSENATATESWRLDNADTFTLMAGESLAVGGNFLNDLDSASTTWTNTTLRLYGGNDYAINTATTSDTYATLDIDGMTQIRMWNSDASTYSVNGAASLYSQDHSDVAGDLYIWGSYEKSNADDYWSYATDFDGTALGGSSRKVDVYIATSSSVNITGGDLLVSGATTASTTIQSMGTATYGITIGGSASTTWQYYEIRDVDTSGLVFTGTPNVNSLSSGDIDVSQNTGSAITVGGTVITQNPAKNFNLNRFTLSAGSGFNVTATGTSVSSWRFVNHYGGLDGEANDVDPDGDPGYVAWDDSAALITISGNVYSDEGSTVSNSACDGSVPTVRLVVAGLSSASTSCNATTGAYSFSNVSYGASDSLIVYLNGTATKAAVITKEPVSNINGLDLYENRVIVRHENTNSMNIADMAVWDSSDDADIQFTAVDAGSDTLTVAADNKLVVWDNKEFEPLGDVTISGGGAGAAYDGSVQLYDGATWTGAGTEALTIGGSFELDSGAAFVASNGTTTFTTTGASRTIDINEADFNHVAFAGSGSWTIADATFTVGGHYSQSAGTLTLPTGTSTFSGSLTVTGGSFDANDGLAIFDGVSTQSITAGGSALAEVHFTGGDYQMLDTNATATESVLVYSGDLSLPNGIFEVGGDFRNIGGTVTHNTSILDLTSTTTALLLASSSDLYSVTFSGGATSTMEDNSLTLIGDLTISDGFVTLASGTLSVGGSLGASGGTFDNATGTILFNSADTGETVDPGNSDFYNVQFSAPTGGYTFTADATTTNNFVIASISSFTVQSGAVLAVNGVFMNSVGGSATTWSGSTLFLDGSNAYSINAKSDNGDQYDSLLLGQNSDLRIWNSAATTTTIDPTSSLYSQDHGNVNGALYIYGDFHIGTTTEYWSYATDFDGTDISGGSERAVTVYHATSATTTVDGGSLQMIGSSGNETTVTSQGGDNYGFDVSAGILNAQYYAFRNLNATGLNLTATPTITSLAYGDFELAVAAGSMITVSSTTINANASLSIPGVRFATTTAITGNNVNHTGSTSNTWTFTGHTGNLDGESFDVDGVTDCGSIRWADSSCLLVQQTNFRWRNDDGGPEVQASEWYDTDWNARKYIRVENVDASTYTNAAIELTVAYDSDMQADFDDLRFTSADGTTLIPHWIGSTTNSSVAEVWVQIASFTGNDTTDIYMYYNNPTATTTSSSTAVFVAADDFEDNNITEYSGQTTLFGAGTSFNFDGTYGLDNAGSETGRANLGGIFRFDQTVSQGERIRYWQYVDTGSGSSDETCTLFGVQSPGTTTANYAVCLEQFGTDRVSLVKNAVENDSSGTVLSSSTITYSTGWYEIEIDWETDNSISVIVYDAAGTVAATTSATDATYTSGGFGFSYWFHYGGWDSFSSRPLLATEPTPLFGVEQTDGGATWKASQNTAASYDIGDIARLRVSVENSGLDITNQQFQIEYADLGTAPSCEAVDGSAFQVVPVQASCGVSPICMQGSSNITNGASTVDLLTDVSGMFTAGELLENPSNKTGNMNINQDFYTELEYVITPTVNVSDEYICFRVTNNGVELDTYLEVAQMAFQFDPIVNTITLNDGQPISLLPGATTTVYATGTVTDLNGFADLNIASSTIYRSGVTGGASCTADNNDCYISTTASAECSFTACSGNSCTVECTADIYFHADPTDVGTYAGEEWVAFVEVEDAAGGYGFNSTASGVELNTLRAINVTNSIDYGSLAVNDDTGATNSTTSISNLGNVESDVEISGTDLSDGGSSVIASNNQRFATTTFNYSLCGAECNNLSSTTPTDIDVDLTKPTVDDPLVSDDVYWGVFIPFGANSAPHQGVNVFTAVSP